MRELHLNIKALKSNIKQLRKWAWQEGEGFFCPMIKADAYGLGAGALSRPLYSAGVRHLGVLSLEEALEIGRPGLRIYIFGPLTPSEAEVVLKQGFVPVISRWGDLKALAKAQRKTPGSLAAFHLKFNTGMNRLGFALSDREALKQFLIQNPGLVLQGLCSHLGEGERAGLRFSSFSRQQIKRFQNTVQDFKSHFPGKFLRTHLLNSAGWFSLWSHGRLDPALGFRPGICLYGVKPPVVFSDRKARDRYNLLCLKPVLCLKSRIVQVRSLKPGEWVSYGRSFRAKKKSVVAVVEMGYADGFLRSLSGRAFVLLRGRPVPVIGSVCMDFFMVDVSRSEKEAAVQCGEEVVLFGKQKGREISLQEQAQKAGTLPHELLTRLGKRVVRVYK